MANEESHASNLEQSQQKSVLTKSQSTKSLESHSKRYKCKSEELVEQKSRKNVVDEHFQDEIVLIFDSNEGSPYSRRYPMFVNKELR